MSIWFTKTNEDGSKSVITFSFPFFMVGLIILGIIASFIVPNFIESKDEKKITYLQQITSNHKLEDIFNFLGKPDAEIGSGLYIYSYILDDGSKILIGSSDNTTVMYIKQIHKSGDITDIYT